MTRIVLVRHGESLWNVERRYQGQQDSGLTERGRAQADLVADALCHEHGQVPTIWSSDSPRARDTAAPYAHSLGIEVVTDARLREVDIGSWAGARLDDMAEREPATVAAFASGEDVRRGGGETFAELRSRVMECLWGLADLGRPIALAFCHGGAVRVAAAAAAGIAAPGHHQLGAPTNCSRTIIDLDPSGHTRLVAYNIPLDSGADPTSVSDQV